MQDYLSFDKILEETKYPLGDKLGFGGKTRVGSGKLQTLPQRKLNPCLVDLDENETILKIGWNYMWHLKLSQ